MEHLEAFKHLFRGQDKAYGMTKVTGKLDSKGKNISMSYTKKKPITDEIWLDHLNGVKDKTLGRIPIMDDDHVHWAALDIDVYNGDLNFNELLKQTADSPFVVCRSKSGGAHLYVFFTEPAPAIHIIEKMESFRAVLGRGGSEIFPKQHTIKGEDTDGISGYGNFINLPYDGPRTLRYCVRDVETNALTLEEFLTYADSKKINPSDFISINTSVGDTVLPDGPPCLNALFGEKIGELEMRNVALANAAVYFKKAHPEEWKEKLNELNQRLPDSLTDRELENIKKSYEKHDYKYQCSKEPLCRHCDNRLCRSRAFGIGYNEIISGSSDLTQIETDPPVWVFVLRGEALRLSTDELIDYRKFTKRCAEVLKLLPEPVKQKDWDEFIREALKTCKTIHIPKEMTPHGMCTELIKDFFDTATDEIDMMPHGRPYRDSECVRFKLKDLLQYLSINKFTQLKPNEISSLLTEKFKAENKVVKVGKETRKSIRHIMVPYQMEVPTDITPYQAEEEHF